MCKTLPNLIGSHQIPFSIIFFIYTFIIIGFKPIFPWLHKHKKCWKQWWEILAKYGVILSSNGFSNFVVHVWKSKLPWHCGEIEIVIEFSVSLIFCKDLFFQIFSQWNWYTLKFIVACSIVIYLWKSKPIHSKWWGKLPKKYVFWDDLGIEYQLCH